MNNNTQAPPKVNPPTNVQKPFLLKLSLVQEHLERVLKHIQVAASMFVFQPLSPGDSTLVGEAAVVLKKNLDAQFDAQTDTGKKRVDAIVINLHPQAFDGVRLLLGWSLAANRLQPIDQAQALEGQTWAEEIVELDQELRGQAVIQIKDFKLEQQKAAEAAKAAEEAQKAAEAAKAAEEAQKAAEAAKAAEEAQKAAEAATAAEAPQPDVVPLRS